MGPYSSQFIWGMNGLAGQPKAMYDQGGLGCKVSVLPDRPQFCGPQPAGLLLFCAAAPVAAVVTFVLLGSLAAVSDARNVALCVLFSGGTVLHAGLVHVLPSVLPPHHHSSGGGSHAGHLHHHSCVDRAPLGAAATGPSGSGHRPRGGVAGHAAEVQDVPPADALGRSAAMAVMIISSLVPLLISAMVPDA